MANIIGQPKIVNFIENATLATLPKALMLIGPNGSGRHLIASTLSDKLGCELIEITEKVEALDLIDYSQMAAQIIFVIDLANFTERQQNQLLKFIEEPSDNAHVLVLAESEVGILPTILNRCQKIKLETYTKESIIEITHTMLRDDLIFELINAPGQIKNISESIIANLKDLCSKIITNVQRASYANTLSISRKLNYTEDYDKPDYNLFMNMLENLAFKDYVSNNTEQSFKIYTLTNEYRQRLVNNNLNKEYFIVSFLTALWEATR